MPTGNTQQVINYGATANDGQGDPLRTAFIKTDENFDNIWLAGPAGSNVRITNNTIGVLDTNGNLILSPNGIGVIQTNNHLVPRANRTYNLGSSGLQYSTVYANAAVFQAVSISGNLTVTGNIIEMGNIVTDALTIQLANTATTGSDADGAGITVGLDDDIATLLYNSSDNVWTTNIGVSVTGDVTANAFIGDGSQLTNVPAAGTSGDVQVNWQGSFSNQGGTPGDTYSTLQFDSNGMPTLDGTTAYQQRVDYSPYLQVLAPRVESTDFGIVAGPAIQITGYADDVFYNTPRSAYLSVQDQATATQQWDFGILGYGSNSYSISDRTNGAKWDFDTTGNLILPDIANPSINYANGSPYGGTGGGNYGNANVANFLANYGSNTITTTGNVSAGNVLTSAGVIASGVIQSGTGLSTGGYLSVDGTTDLHDTTVTGNLSVSVIKNDDSTVVKIEDGVEIDGDALVNGGVTADAFIGNGNLTLQPDPANPGSYLDIFLTSGPDLHLVASNGANLILGKDDGANVMTSWNGNAYIQSWDLNTGNAGGVWTFNGDGLTDLPDGTRMGAVEGAGTFGFYNANASTEFLVELGSSNVWGFDGDTGGTIFPQVSVQRGDNPSGTITGQTLLFNNPGQEAIISTPDGVNGIPNSQRLVINPGQGYDNGEGGDIYLWAGRGGPTDGSGGDIKIRGGQGLANGTGGYIRIEGGDTQGAGYPGYIDIKGGRGGATQGAYVRITGGQGATNGGEAGVIGGYGTDVGGDANITAGYGGTNQGGNVNITGGGSALGLPGYGNVNISAGASQWVFDNTGNLTVPGNILGSGNILIAPDSASSSSYLDIYLTGGPDIHIASNDNSIVIGRDTGANIFVGNDGEVSIRTDDGTTAQVWNFDDTGNLSAPGNISASGNITGAYVKGNGSELSGLPAPTVTQDITSNGAMSIMTYDGAIKYVNYATVEPSSGNIAGGNISTTGNVTAGNVNSPTLNNSGNISVVAGGNTWTFGTDGRLINLEGLTLTAGGQFNICTILTGGSGYNTGSALKATTGGSGTGMTVGIGYGLSNQLANADVVDPGTGYVDGDVITVSGGTGGTFRITRYNDQANQGNNNFIESNWTFGNAGNLTLPGNTFAVNYANGTAVSLGGAGNYSNANVVAYGEAGWAGNIIPSANATYTLGNSTMWWSNAWFASNTIYIGGVPLGVSNSELTVNGNTVVTANATGTSTTTGNVSITGNVTAGNIIATNIGNIASLNLDGNASTILYGNGVFAAAAPSSSYGNANVVANLAALGSNPVSTTGNVTAGYVIGNGSLLSSITGANVTGTVANATYALTSNAATYSTQATYAATANAVAGANVSGTVANATYATSAGSATTAATVTTAAQPNITSVGTLTSVVVTGNITGGNIATAGQISATGNATFNAVSLTGSSGNITGADQVLANAFSASGNVTSGGLTVFGNAIITGNTTVQGTLTYNNLTNITTPNLVFGLANTSTGISANGAGFVVGNTSQASFLYNYGTTAWNSNIGISAVGNITGGNLITAGVVSAAGNVSGNYILGNGALLTGVITSVANINLGTSNVTVVSSGGNVAVGVGGTPNVAVFASTGEYITGVLSVSGNANVGNIGATNVVATNIAGTLTTAAQTNITSVGTLGTLSVTGNASTGNVSGTTGTFTNIVGTLTTAAQPNITSTGTLTSVTVTGNVTGGNIVTGGLATVTGNITAGNLVTAGMLSATGNANVGNIGATNGVFSGALTGITTLNASGNANVGNIGGTNAVFANLTGTLTTAAQPNITSTGTLTSVTVTGNVTGGNVLTGGLISATGNITTANSFVGNLVGTTVSVTGNVSAGNVIVNGQPTTYGYVNPGYVNVGLNTTISGIGAGSTFIYDTVLKNNGTAVTYNTGTGVFTLTAGVTYNLMATGSWVTFSDTSGGYIVYSWVDATTNTRLDTTGDSDGIAEPLNRPVNEFGATATELIYTPVTNQTVKVYVVAAGGTASLRGGIGSKAIVTQLNPSIAVQATATGTVAATVVANTSPVVTTTNSGNASSPGLTVMTLAIPTAGTWRLDAELRVSVPGTGYMGAAFYDNGTLIPGSEYWVAGGATNGSGAGGSQYGGFMSYNLTTTGARTVTLGIWASGSTVQCISSSDGRTWARATQIDSIFALNAIDTISTTGNVSVGGNLNVTGTSTSLITKASGLVNQNVYVTLGNLKVRMAGASGLQVATVSGTYSVYGSGIYAAGTVGLSFIDGGTPLTITTTPAYLKSGLNFSGAGNTDTWTIMDTGNSIAWRITLIVGSGYNSNMISIERLV